MFRRFRHHAHRPATRPASSGRIRRMGLRRTLEMLETGERINDRLYRWTLTQPRAVALRPGLA
jgi:hypothetical protein